MRYLAPKIEENDGKYTITVCDADAPGYRRAATPDEAHQAILYFISEVIKKLPVNR